MVSPLIQSQPPEIRNTARFCNSSIEPTRPIGFLAMVRAPGASLGLRRLLMPSVGISPGAMVLRRMPYSPHSIASDIGKPRIADLLLAAGPPWGEPLRTQVTVIDTTLPRSLLAI